MSWARRSCTKIKQSFYSQQVTLQDNYCKKYIVVCCVNYSLDLPKDLELFLRNYHKGKDDEGRKNMYKRIYGLLWVSQ